jgi:hypothetical protein
MKSRKSWEDPTGESDVSIAFETEKDTFFIDIAYAPRTALVLMWTNPNWKRSLLVSKTNGQKKRNKLD